MTRFEVTLRNTKLAPQDLATLSNPFAELRLVMLEPGGQPLSRRLLIQFARAFGIESLRAVTSAEEYASVRDDICAHGGRPTFHPADCFDADWQRLVRKLFRILGLSVASPRIGKPAPAPAPKTTRKTLTRSSGAKAGRRCPFCGGLINPEKRAHARFCSNSCRVRDHRAGNERKKERRKVIDEMRTAHVERARRRMKGRA